METTSMTITIIIDGIERNFAGDYHTLHNIEWNDIICDQIDSVHNNEDTPD